MIIDCFLLFNIFNILNCSFPKEFRRLKKDLKTGDAKHIELFYHDGEIVSVIAYKHNDEWIAPFDEWIAPFQDSQDFTKMIRCYNIM